MCCRNCWNLYKRTTSRKMSSFWELLCLGLVECHPYLNQTKLLEYCKSKDIAMVAYAALGSNRGKEWIKKDNPVLLEDPVLNSIAEKHRRTPAQVALHYQLQPSVLALAKSFNKRIQENFQVFDFQLTPEDMKILDGLNRNIRYINDSMLTSYPDYPFFMTCSN
ncbi:aldo-keto reductase family 1 member C15 [Nannospalax galili]|uniref:aldo-keto reductase family 1 member C15 n=1 Tax=Nannospalax galili TaxID=1026970 RepID=UPI0004ED28E6|nr:aldo-keto reductase family 1 member C15 [Nannospalax galili]